MTMTPQTTTPDPLSPRQLASLKGIINGILPPLDPPETSSENEEYWKHDLSCDKDFIDALTLAIQVKLYAHERFQMNLLLGMLSTTLGTFGVFQIPTTTSFTKWSPAEQSRALQKLQHSSLTLNRKAFSSLKRLICGLAYSYINIDTNTNPFWEAMQYPGPPPALNEEPASKPDFDTDQAFLQVNGDTKTLTYDVVIVGSGAGGGVAAVILSKSGYSVLVLEKGPYISPSQISNFECEALDLLYEKHALLTTNDGNIMILAGATLGGGTTVNWACCLPLPESVREEWIHDHGLTQFESDEYHQSLQQVSERIGCTSTHTVVHNAMNQNMKDGCNVMGYTCETTGQNLRDTSQESAGYTCFGDAERNKQSGLVTYLADAVESGAKIIEHAAVQRILYETNTNGRKRAVGILAIVDDKHEIRVKARKCVIVAAGSLNSPCLLQRSGFRNPHIGRHLHLHPVTAASGFFDDKIHSYLGAPMTTVCSDFPNAKLECPCAHTGLLAAGLPFQSSRDFKDKMSKLSQAMPLIVLQRDVESEGRVRVGADGFSPSIDYKLSKEDKRDMMSALKGAIQVLIASGANEVGTGHMMDSGLKLNGETFETANEIEKSDKIQSYLASIDKRGMREHEFGVFSAHQMSTCRMSASPDSGVVDVNGECWECDDLMVFDASVFPTASGANPMLTTLTISHMLSSKLVMRLQFEDNEAAGKSGTAEATELMDERKKRRVMQPHYGFTTSTIFQWPWVVGIVAIASAGAVKYWRD